MYICKPSKAKTASEKMVKIITSLRFFTDSISAPTMVLRPGKVKRKKKGKELEDVNMKITFTFCGRCRNHCWSSSIFMQRARWRANGEKAMEEEQEEEQAPV